MEAPKNKHKFNITTALICQVSLIICGLIMPKLIITNFGSEVNGLINSITQFLAYIVLLEAGVGPLIKSMMYRPFVDNDAKKLKSVMLKSDRYFRRLSFFFVIYVIILSIIYPFIVIDTFNYFFTFSLIFILSINKMFEYFYGMSYRLLLSADGKAYIVSVLQIITYVLNIIVIVILIMMECNIHVVKLVSALVFIIRPVCVHLYVKRKYQFIFKEDVVIDNYKLEGQNDVLAQHLAYVINDNTDVVVLTMFASLNLVSVYSIYNLIINGIKSIVSSFASGIDSTLGKLYVKKEMEKLNCFFAKYELYYFVVITILYISTYFLIIPFVEVYTLGITDVNYIAPFFAAILVLANFMFSIRYPYRTLTLAAGKFKETKNGAILESVLNLGISIILVINFGLIGVAIGTFVAMFVRTIEFINFTSKNILCRKKMVAYKRLLLIIVQFLISAVLISALNEFTDISYVSWILYSVKVVTISSLVVLISTAICYTSDVKHLILK